MVERLLWYLQNDVVLAEAFDVAARARDDEVSAATLFSAMAGMLGVDAVLMLSGNDVPSSSMALLSPYPSYKRRSVDMYTIMKDRLQSSIVFCVSRPIMIYDAKYVPILRRKDQCNDVENISVIPVSKVELEYFQKHPEYIKFNEIEFLFQYKR